MQTRGKVRIFRQNDTMETCLCCCVWMVLDYYRRLPEGAKYPTKDMENRLYRMSVSYTHLTLPTTPYV